MNREFDAVKKKSKPEKLQSLIKCLLNYERQENLMSYFNYTTLSINKTLPRNYRGITLTAIPDKVYNALFLKRIQFLGKIRTVFREIDSQLHRLSLTLMVQSARPAKYTDCISTEG